MGLLKGALKVAGTTVLGAAGLAAGLAGIIAGSGSMPGSDELADVLKTVREASFNRIGDMWTPDEEKDDLYKSMQKAELEGYKNDLNEKLQALRGKEGEIRAEYERRSSLQKKG